MRYFKVKTLEKAVVLTTLLSFPFSGVCSKERSAEMPDTIVAKEVRDIQYEFEKVEPRDNRPKLRPYGFVRNYFFYDTRDNIGSVSELFNQIPKDQKLNTMGEDVNENPTVSFLAITTRLGLNLSGLHMLRAMGSAKIEADFAGFASSTTMLRIRQAYFKLNWQKQALLAGQTWHPMFGDYMPDVLGLATGSPFQPFSRTPQVRYDFYAPHVRFTADALWQMQYKSVGPDGQSEKYLNDGILPELYLGAEYQAENIRLGVGADFLRLKPRNSFEYSYMDSVYNKETQMYDQMEKTDTRKVKEHVGSISPMIYARYFKNNLNILAKVVYAQNTSHLNMMSGYAVTGKNDDGSFEYSPLRGLSTFVNASYTLVNLSHYNKVKFNLFGGFFKNFGCADEIVGDLYIKNNVKNIDYFFRVSPSVSYLFLSYFTVGLEYELTTVGYGDGCDKFGAVDAVRNVSNNRVCAMLKFAF